MNLEVRIAGKVADAVESLYQQELDPSDIQIQRTRKDFKGDFTVVVFPLLRFSKKPPEQTAEEIGEFLKDKVSEISGFNVIKGFLNLNIASKFWITFLNSINSQDVSYSYYFSKPD